MTLAQLRAAVAAMLQVTEASFAVTGVNLLHVAIDNARRYAESHHDFEQTKVLARLTIDEVAGGLWTGYVTGVATGLEELTNSAVTVIVKTIIEIGELNDDETDIVPGKWLSDDEYRQRVRSMEGSERDPDVRYPATDGPRVCLDDVDYIVRGTRIFQNPAGTAGETRDIGLYVARFQANYIHTGAGDQSTHTDLYLDIGGQFMLWQTILELNFLNKQFVPRQEGNLSIADVIRMRDNAWNAFTLFDTYRFNKTPGGHL